MWRSKRTMQNLSGGSRIRLKCAPLWKATPCLSKCFHLPAHGDGACAASRSMGNRARSAAGRPSLSATKKGDRRALPLRGLNRHLSHRPMQGGRTPLRIRPHGIAFVGIGGSASGALALCLSQRGRPEPADRLTHHRVGAVVNARTLIDRHFPRAAAAPTATTARNARYFIDVVLRVVV